MIRHFPPLSSLPLVLAAAAALLATPAFAQRNLKEIPSTDPAVEQATFQLAPGLEVNLFASEPMIHKPIQMAWDEKGRLWVASSAIYPHIKPGQTETDKILVLEDTDGDGKADKSTTFYEGLLVPTGILPGDGGAYVANSTELLFMKDTDGDGKADTKEVLLSGFGTEDTHHILHGFKRGPDGCLYLMQSVYIHAHIETPFGVRRLMGSGIWQYRPETGRLEVFAMGHVNPWGHIFDKWGQSFTTDGAYGEGINYTFPGATFICLPNQRARILKGLNPGQPKQCGLEVISGRHFPDDWQGDLITNDFRGHRVNRFKVSDQGSGFASRQMEDVLRSTHGSFRPVDVKMGPDGALYIADWYNPIIQHGEVDFRDERRDRVHGRIWRVSVKGREKCPKVDYAKKSVDELIALLKEPEQWVRLEARTEFANRCKVKGEAASQAIGKLIEALTAFIDRKDIPFGAEAYWLLGDLIPQMAGGPAEIGKVIEAAMGGPSQLPELRALGARIAGQLAVHHPLPAEVMQSVMKRAAYYSGDEKRFVADGSARVRLEAINALRMFATPHSVELACKALDHPMDENLDFALWLTCSELADVWLPAFQKGEITFGGNVAHIAYALKAANKPEAVGALLTMVSEGKVTGDRVKDVIGIVGALGSKADLTKMMEFLAAPVGDGSLSVAALDALGTAAQQRNVKPDGGAETVVNLMNNGAPPLQAAAIRLAGAWKVEAARPKLEELAKQPGSAEKGAPVLQALAALGNSEGIFRHLLHERLVYVVPYTAEIIANYSRVNAQAAAADAAEFFAGKWQIKDDAEGTAAAGKVVDAFLAQKNGTAILAAALKDKKIPAAIATAGVQRASAVGGDTKALVEALTIAGGLQPVMALTPEQLTQMMAEVKTAGDPARGELIYRRANLQCTVCHAISAVGGIVGPDLVSIGASAPVDYIIDSLLEPSKKIKEGYATTMLTTKDGGVHSGFLVRADDREVILRDAAGNPFSIPANTVAKQESVPVSLMPPALTATLRRDEFVDLVRFLSELGKEGGYKIQEDGTLRRWRTAQPPAEAWRWMNLNGNKGFHEKATDLTWLPLYSRVDGTVHGEDATLIKVGNNEWRAIESEIEVSAAGKIGLKVNDPAGLQIFIAGKEVPAAADIQTDAPAGKVRVTILFDTAARKTPLKVQAYDVPGSPAKTKAVRGM
jgi:putative heme-binding domain-containing protein